MAAVYVRRLYRRAGSLQWRAWRISNAPSELPGGIPPPTSELKRQALAVQDLADRLIDAPAEVIAGLELPEKLADAIALARRITSRAALTPATPFVAKLMRGIDLGQIQSALDLSG